jgi:hypothetical protein
MKAVNHYHGIGKHLLDYLWESSPPIYAHLFNFCSHLYGLLLQGFNNVFLLVTVNHFNQFSSLNVADNGGEVLMELLSNLVYEGELSSVLVSG